MRSPTSCDGASLVMFGIRLETLPMEASTSVSPYAFVVRGGLGLGLVGRFGRGHDPQRGRLGIGPDLAARAARLARASGERR